MANISLKISEELDAKLRVLSQKKCVSKSSLIREAIETQLRREFTETTPSAYELMVDGIGIETTGCRDLGSNSEHLEGFGR